MSDAARERWMRIQELADAALDMDPDEVPAFLDRACAAESELRAEVEDLLRWCDRAASFLEEPAAERAAPLLALDFDPAAGRRVGVYRILKEAGRGGMGTVYLAERDDAEFQQHVALKLVRSGLTGEDALRRFRDERQILASMNHPGIARLFDGGVADDGSPYFVMEFVEGEPIDRYCDDAGLSIERRLELFLRVCDAVQYAHAQLVVHRDIKPSNILITADGAVKLLDFGIAKVLAVHPAEDERAVTRTGIRPMTPEYASPEQVAGEAVSTATDIYSLGVLLYKLLTGRLPHPRGGLPGELERSILEREPERPSAAVLQAEAAEGERAAAARASLPRRLSRRLRGDLDTIVLRSMQKDAARRYSTAAHLADDVRRHLSGLPVTARPDRWSYRARRFVRRHRIGTAAAAAFALLLLGATTVTSVQAARIRRQSLDIMRERDRASAVSDFLLEVFRASDPTESAGQQVTALELLDRASERIDRELDGQPDTRAAMQRVMAKAYHNLGQYDRAEPLYRAALDARPADQPGEITAALILVDLGNLAHDRGLLDEAEALFAEALDTLRARPDAQDTQLGTALDNLGMVRYRRRDLDGAEALHREGLALRRRSTPPDSTAIAASLNNLALVLKERGEYDPADSLFLEAIAIQRATSDDDETGVASTLNNRGVLLVARGDNEEGRRMFEESLAIRRRVFGDHHPQTLEAMNNLAAALERMDDLAAAESLYRESLARKIEAVGERHPSVATGMNNLGLLLLNRGELGQADSLLRRSLALRRALYGDRSPVVATALHNLASLQDDRGEPAEAMALFRQALEIRREALGEDNPIVAVTALSLGVLLFERGDLAAAEPLLRDAARIRRAVLDPGDPRTAQAEGALGAALSALGRFEEAGPLLRNSVASLRAALGEDDRSTHRVREWLEAHERRAGERVVVGRR